jgi:hypothetical protein
MRTICTSACVANSALYQGPLRMGDYDQHQSQVNDFLPYRIHRYSCNIGMPTHDICITALDPLVFLPLVTFSEPATGLKSPGD